ncbi:MAG: proton-conducting transporter membrane subunit [Ilumatobacteraceae bacterium]
MNALLTLPIMIPLLGAAACLAIPQRLVAQRVVALVALGAATAVAIALAVLVDRDGPASVALGGWNPLVGVALVADRLASLVLVVALVMLSAVAVYAIGQRARSGNSPFYYPAYLGLSAGVSGAFLAGDLFNLFVFFEVLLMASYVLMTLEGTNAQIRSGTTYVVLNVVESTVLLAAVGLVYAATGTVNFAELPERLAELPDSTRTALNLLLLLAFGLKAAVFPLFFWLPDSYPSAASPVTAVFAGLLTKIGVYAMIRTETLLFPGDERNLLLVVAGATMLVGAVGAIAHKEMKRILSFHIVSQIGYLVLGIAIGTEAALAATVFYLVHHIPVKTSLFLVEGIVEDEAGTSDIDRISGLARVSGPLAVLFLIPALSLAGIPPFSGFVAKLGIIRSGIEGGAVWYAAIGLLASVLTLVSMTKIWVGAFWGPADTEPKRPLTNRRLMTGATTVVVAVTLAVAAFAGPLFELAQRAAQTLHDPAAYIQAVRGS